MHFRGVEGWWMHPSDRATIAQFLEFSDVLADVLPGQSSSEDDLAFQWTGLVVKIVAHPEENRAQS